MSTSSADFAFVLCPGNRPDPRFRDVYDQIYTCWQEVWKAAFEEIGVQKKLHADAFTRQDLIGATFYRGKCIGMCFFRWTDGSRIDFADDSYFDIWQPEHQAALCAHGSQVIVCSNLTLHPEGRGQKLGVSGKDLIAGMSVQLFRHSQADAMTGAMRVDRGANTTTARWGSQSIAQRVPCEYGANNTELVCFYNDDMSASMRHELFELTEKLWENRMVITRMDATAEFELPGRSAGVPQERVA